MRTLMTLVGMTLLIAASSGCIGGNSPAATTSTSPPASSGAPTGASGGPGNGTQNDTASAPVVHVKVLDNGTELSLVNGSYQVLSGVNITLDASGSTGANLSFAWDLGDNATATNATVVHAWTNPGNVSVGLTVTGSVGAANTTLAFSVSSATPVVIRSDKQPFSGTLTMAGPDPTYTAGCRAVNKDGVDFKDFTWTLVDKEADGSASVANHTVIALTASGTAPPTIDVDVDLYFFDATGKQVAKSDGPTGSEKIDLLRDLPAGAYKIEVVGCVGANVTINVAAQEDYIRG